MNRSDFGILRNMVNAIGPLALAGALGVLARWSIGRFLPWPGGFPWATLFINSIGCLLIGLAAGFSKRLPVEWLNIICIGFLGGFTTLSAFSIETILLVERGQGIVAMVYYLLTPFLGVLLAFLGLRLGQWGP